MKYAWPYNFFRLTKEHFIAGVLVCSFFSPCHGNVESQEDMECPKIGQNLGGSCHGEPPGPAEDFASVRNKLLLCGAIEWEEGRRFHHRFRAGVESLGHFSLCVESVGFHKLAYKVIVY